MDKESTQLIGDSKASSPPRPSSAISTAETAAWPTAATTSKTWRARASFEEVCHLLWYGELPNAAQARQDHPGAHHGARDPGRPR